MYSFILGIYAQCTSIISNFVVCEYNDNKGFSISILSSNKCMNNDLSEHTNEPLCKVVDSNEASDITFSTPSFEA